MKTIIQKLPTIYGEALNGSVYGQPNGSIARPPQNVSANLVLSGDDVVVELVSQGAQFTTYSLMDLTIGYTIPSGYSRVYVLVKKADNSSAAAGYINPDSATRLVTGPNPDQPADEDPLTVIVQFLDSDNNVIVQDSISATANMVI